MLALLLAGTALVGFGPTPAAAEGVQTMTGTMEFSAPPAIGSSYCKTISGPVLATVATDAFAGPIAATATGTVCGTWPISITGNLAVWGSVTVGPVTASISCSGAISGTIPGTTNYFLSCLLTVTTPFGTTSQSLCISGVLYLLAPGPIYIGAGISPC